MRTGFVVLGVGLATIGCGGRSVSPGSDGVAAGGSSAQAGAATSGPECRRSPVFDDAGPGTCLAGATLADCRGSNGYCRGVSNDDPALSDCGKELASPVECKNDCAANEYAVVCNSPGFDDPVSYQQLPDDCRSVSDNPGSNVYGCCPCQ